MRKILVRRYRWGGLYLLIGPQTFSAAQNLANRLERETLAIFVGTPTGGAPNHYGDATLFVEKPGSGHLTCRFVLPQDKRLDLPDIIVPAFSTDCRPRLCLRTRRFTSARRTCRPSKHRPQSLFSKALASSDLAAILESRLNWQLRRYALSLVVRARLPPCSAARCQRLKTWLGGGILLAALL
ncbi:MAG: hypothetical protein IPF97_04295 [Sphingomonadales bacterium]|nr:hypothetical protein [Sphingomonadales bacterium]